MMTAAGLVLGLALNGILRPQGMEKLHRTPGTVLYGKRR